MKRKLVILLSSILVCCISMVKGWKNLDLGGFKMFIPNEWNYKKAKGKDSFVGYIIGPKSSFSFDYSPDGYAGDVIPSGVALSFKNTYYINIDTTSKYVIETIWPKISEKGYTGIYIKSRTTNLTFNLIASNLHKHEEELALQVFKTIKLKD